MASKPEASFVRSVNKYIPKEVYHVGMANPYVGGIPDRYYDGNRGDLWVEYKFIPKITGVVLPKLSALQTAWLNRAHDNGRNVAVIVGCPDGGKLYQNKMWQLPVKKKIFEITLMTRRELAEWIIKQVAQ